MDKSTRKFLFLVLMSAATAVLLICYSRGISGNDFWWHMKTGEWICEHHAVPRQDIYSWYGVSHGFEWVAQEWLSQLIFWVIYHNCGEGGIFLFSLGAAFLMTALIIVRNRRYLQENFLLGFLYIFVFSILEIMFFYGRPHIFSFFLLYAELCCLYEYAEGGRKWCLYLLPAVSCLWSNLHGGSANLSYLLVLAVLFCGVREWKIGRLYSEKWDRWQRTELMAVSLLCMGAVCIQPAGYKIFLYPYQSMANGVMLRSISEWAAPDAKNIGNLLLYFIPVALLCFGLLFGERKVRLMDAAIVFLFLFLFLRSARFVMYLYIAISFGAVPYQLPCRIKNLEKTWEKVCFWGVELLILAVIGSGVKACADTWKEGRLITTVLEEAFVDVIREDAPDRLYNDYNYGGALIFQGIPVFVDERADPYFQDDLLQDAISLMTLRFAEPSTGGEWTDAETLIAKYEFDAFLIKRNRPLFGYLASHEDRYEAVLVTDETGYFRKKENR